MFELTTRNGNISRTEKYIDGCSAYKRFLWFIENIDIEEVVVTNGFTGEVLNLWRNGKFKVFNGYSVE